MIAPSRNRFRYRLAHVWQVVWGLPQALIGFVLYVLLFRGRHHVPYRSAFVTEWRLKAGLSMGMFIFVPEHSGQSLLAHEYGHTIQSLILGPLYLPAIVLPSLIWAGTPALQRYRSTRQYSYYRFYCERWANHLSHLVTGERPEGWTGR